jgi:hypothetical protein
LQFCSATAVKGFTRSAVYTLVICFLSMSPWFCDHLARLVLLPARREIQLREPQFKYVDILFVGIYLAVFTVLLVLWRLVK